MIAYFAGCASVPSTESSKRGLSQVIFISFPPGAVIDIDGEYKGRTPLKVMLTEHHMQRNQNIPMYKVFAYASQEGYCTQKQALSPYHLPQQVTFDMSNCSDL